MDEITAEGITIAKLVKYSLLQSSEYSLFSLHFDRKIGAQIMKITQDTTLIVVIA